MWSLQHKWAPTEVKSTRSSLQENVERSKHTSLIRLSSCGWRSNLHQQQHVTCMHVGEGLAGMKEPFRGPHILHRVIRPVTWYYDYWTEVSGSSEDWLLPQNRNYLYAAAVFSYPPPLHPSASAIAIFSCAIVFLAYWCVVALKTTSTNLSWARRNPSFFARTLNHRKWWKIPR